MEGAICPLLFNLKNFIEKYKRRYDRIIEAILNNKSATIGTNSILTEGSSNNVRWEIGSLNQKKGTFSLL